jgi:tRNA-dihydrouridine synthase B
MSSYFMSRTFWNSLAKPLLGLSPMDGVTDHPFRFIHKKYGNPDLIYTEFTSVEGVCHGADRLLKDFLFDETQRPIIGQIYGTTPDFFRQTATLLCELGFDGIDVNMGCPAKNVAHSGAGAGLIKTPQLAQEIVRATKAGITDYHNGKRARDCANLTQPIWQEVERRHQALPEKYQQPRPIPVSVKTRVGYDSKIIDQWLPYLLEVEPVAIAIHGRTLKQQYGGEADWTQIGLAKQVAQPTPTLILGNGDVKTLEDVHQKITTYGLDGVLIGRAAMGNPLIFGRTDHTPKNTNPFAVALEHARLFETTYSGGEYYNFLPMRKHLGWYVNSIPNATQIRIEVFQSHNADEVEAIFKRHELLSD